MPALQIKKLGRPQHIYYSTAAFLRQLFSAWKRQILPFARFAAAYLVKHPILRFAGFSAMIKAQRGESNDHVEKILMKRRIAGRSPDFFR